MINIGIIERNQNRRQELKAFCNTQPELVCTAAAASPEELLKSLNARYPLLTVLLGVEAGKQPLAGQVCWLKQHLPDADIIVLSDVEDTQAILEALQAGALGYIQKQTPLLQLKEVILAVSAGGAYMSPLVARKLADYLRAQQPEVRELTSREREIVTCLTEGLSYKMIASKLVLSLDTVRFHLRNIYKKLHVNSKAEVIAKVLKKDFFQLY